MEARLPTDKVQKILYFTESILGKTCCTKLELLQLFEHFNFASRVVFNNCERPS